MNKKKKSTNTSPYPDEAIDRLARAFYPAILACWNSEEGQREFAAWQAEQAHHTTSKEKQSVPDGERPVIHIAIVCGFLQGGSGWAHPVFVCAYFFRIRIAFRTAMKAKENLLRGRQNRLITPPAKRNRAFPTGNALLYISLLFVAFGRVRPQGAPCFCFAAIYLQRTATLLSSATLSAMAM